MATNQTDLPLIEEGNEVQVKVKRRRHQRLTRGLKDPRFGATRSLLTFHTKL